MKSTTKLLTLGVSLYLSPMIFTTTISNYIISYSIYNVLKDASIYDIKRTVYSVADFVNDIMMKD